MRIRVTETYKTIENADPEAELIADLVGDYLFTDEAFVRSLSTQNRNLFQKIFDEIKYLCKIVTSGSKEARELEKVKKVFSDVYRESGTTQKNTTEEGGVRYSLIGRTVDGTGIYKTNYPKNTQKSIKQADLISLVQNVWSNNPITLEIVEEGTTRKIVANFNPELSDRSDLSKIAFGNRKGNASDQRMTLDLSSDLYQIAADSKYQYSKYATPKPENPAHDGVIKYHYFLTNLIYKDNENNYIDCHMNIDVKQNTEGNWFYSFGIEKGSVPQTLLAAVTENSAALPTHSISNPDENVKQKDVFGFKINENADVNEDLLEEISYFHPDAEVDEQGNITVYHRTTKENAERIRQTSIMTAKEDALFFSSKESGYASDYGDTVVKLKIPSTELRLNDVFDDEVHLDLPLEYKNGGYSLDVSKYLIESNDNSNDIAPVQNSLSNDGEQAAKKYGDYAVSGEDVRLETQDDIAPLSENVESDTEYPDDYAPIGEGVVEDDAEIDGIIKTLKDGLSQKRQNYETERKNLAVKKQETLSNIDDKIAETQAKYDGKKNKDTRIANTLLRRIESLKTRKANIEADYAKRLNNLDSRIQRIDDLSQKDYTQVAEIEKAINRIDKIFEIDKATLDEEFDAKKAEYANKNVFIGREAKKLYDELTNLKKGTRASKQLGYFLDLGYDWNSLKAALAHIDMSPAKLVNVNSKVMISNEDQWA